MCESAFPQQVLLVHCFAASEILDHHLFYQNDFSSFLFDPFKKTDQFTPLHNGWNGKSDSSAGDAAKPCTRDTEAEFDQETRTEEHVGESNENGEENKKVLDAVPQQEGPEQRKEVIELVPFQHSVQNDVTSEVTCPSERDPPRASHEPAPSEISNDIIPGRASLSDVGNSDTQSDSGSISEHSPSEAGDEYSEQELFLEGLVLSDEANLPGAHEQSESELGTAGNIESKPPAHEAMSHSPSGAQTPELTKDFTEHAWPFEIGELSDPVAKAGQIVEIRFSDDQVAKATTKNSQATRPKSPSQGLQLVESKADSTNDIDDNIGSAYIRSQDLSDWGEELAQNELDHDARSEGTGDEDEERPPLAVTEDLEDWDELSE